MRDGPLDPFLEDGDATVDPADLVGLLPPSHASDAGFLSPRDREEIVDDLADLDVFEHVLSRRGIHGVALPCPDCDEPHLLSWDLLRTSLETMLTEGTVPVHEPPFDPRTERFVAWDYARGYVDGLAAAILGDPDRG